MPVTAEINSKGHLTVAGLDTVDLAKTFGTPLWIIDESSLRVAVQDCRRGLALYPEAEIAYAGKAFLCLAMCQLIRELDLSLDVVSIGELYTAQKANLPAANILLHGNNKSEQEIEAALKYGNVRIVVDNYSELLLIASIAQALGVSADILLRVIPGVETDTHHHIQTGHDNSKFGIPLSQLNQAIEYLRKNEGKLNFLGLHAHVGSQSTELSPFLTTVDILADCCQQLKNTYGVTVTQLDIGGGLGIAYTESDTPLPMDLWSEKIARTVLHNFNKYDLRLPKLILEPGRSIIGRAGITLYKVGHSKVLPDGHRYIAVDGGMADNPRPITYQALYSACLANKMNEPELNTPAAIAGKFCEQGDILINESYLAAQKDDLIAVFATGAYNFSMSSNYNRTARPACILVTDGVAHLIIERETNDDLLRNDRPIARLIN
jgi:diaminopimelate decarboxylase